MNAMQNLLDFLCELDKRKIFFSLSQSRHETVMVEITVPGERWEVEFFADGQVEVEIFRSVAGLQGQEALAQLFEMYSN